MFDFPPNSPWPKRIRLALIGFAVFVVVVALLRVVAQKAVSESGGQENFATRAKMKGIAVGLSAFHFAHSRYPSSREGIAILYGQSDSRLTSFFKADDHKPTEDAWGREFRYLSPGDHSPDSYDLWSVGEDGEDGTEDDITNW